MDKQTVVTKSTETLESFATRCAKLGKSFTNAHAILWTLATIAVNKAYGSTDKGGQWVATLINALPQAERVILARYLKVTAGLNIPAPPKDSLSYVIPGDCVIDRKRTVEFLDKVRRTPVMVTEIKAGKEVKEKVLLGLAIDRANKAATAAVERLKKTDPEAAALLNDRICASYTSCMFDNKGEKFSLAHDEIIMLKKVQSGEYEIAVVEGNVEIPAVRLAA